MRGECQTNLDALRPPSTQCSCCQTCWQLEVASRMKHRSDWNHGCPSNARLMRSRSFLSFGCIFLHKRTHTRDSGLFTLVKQVPTNAALTRQLHNNRSTQSLKQSMPRGETKRRFQTSCRGFRTADGRVKIVEAKLLAPNPKTEKSLP